MLFHYTVEYWDEIEKETAIEEGLVTSHDMGSAVNRLVEYYGNSENIGSITIYEVEDVLSNADLYEMVK